MKKKHSLVIEVIVALIVSVILFIAVFPRFQRSQVRVNVAGSLQDLQKAHQALETFSINPTKPSSAYKVQSLGPAFQSSGVYDRNFVQQEGVTKGLNVMKNPQGENVLVEINSSLVRNYALDHEDEVVFTDELLGELPVPRFPRERAGSASMAWGPYYSIQSRDIRMRDHGFPPVNQEPWRYSQYIFQYYHSGYDYEIQGVSPGPFVDQSLYAPGEVPRHTVFHYYTPYDPTNGIMSQGYLLYQAEPLPEDERYDNQPPLPEEERVPIFQHTLQVDDDFMNAPPIQREAVQAEDPLDVETIWDRHKNLISYLELHFKGTVMDYWGIDLMEDMGRKYIQNVLEGKILDSLTTSEVKQYFKNNYYYRNYPVEMIYCAAPERNKWIIQWPRLTKTPWKDCNEYIRNGTETITINHSRRDQFVMEGNHFQFLSDYNQEFHPLLAILPLSALEHIRNANMTKMDQGKVRVQWKDLGDSSPIAEIDAVLDPALDYCAVQSKIVVRKNMQPIRGSLSARGMDPFQGWQYTNLELDVRYFEMGDHIRINGIPVPRKMKITHWMHIDPDRHSLKDANARGLYRGYDIADVIGGEPLSHFKKQWNMQVSFARVNEPFVEDEVFWAKKIHGYKFWDERQRFRRDPRTAQDGYVGSEAEAVDVDTIPR